MTQPLFLCSRFRPTHFVFAVVAAALLCGTSTLAEAPVCTLTFADPVSPAVLNDVARACLDRAALQIRNNPNAHVVLTGSVALRVAAGRQYLLGTRALPPSSVTASTGPGDPHVVQVALATIGGPAAGTVLSGELSHVIQGYHPPPAQGGLVQPPPRAIVPLQPQPQQAGATNARPTQAEHRKAVRPQTGPPPAEKAFPPQPSESATASEKTSAAAQPPSDVQPARPGPASPAAVPDRSHVAPAHQQAAAHHAPHEVAKAGFPKDAQDAYPAGEQVQNWERRLKSGAIDFNSPQTMVVGKPTGVVVMIHGYADSSHATLPGVQQQGVLKVSDYMRVDLDAPLQPGEFRITPAQGAKLPIPIDGSNSWTFQVTPLNRIADPQTLVIHPYLYPPARLDAQPLQERNFTVQVTVEPFWTHIVDLWKDDPVKVAKYLLPGGEGFKGAGAFLTGLIGLLTALGVVAWIRRKILKTDDEPSAKQAPSGH